MLASDRDGRVNLTLRCTFIYETFNAHTLTKDDMVGTTSVKTEHYADRRTHIYYTR